MPIIDCTPPRSSRPARHRWHTVRRYNLVESLPLVQRLSISNRSGSLEFGREQHPQRLVPAPTDDAGDARLLTRPVGNSPHYVVEVQVVGIPRRIPQFVQVGTERLGPERFRLERGVAVRRRPSPVHPRRPSSSSPWPNESAHRPGRDSSSAHGRSVSNGKQATWPGPVQQRVRHFAQNSHARDGSSRRQHSHTLGAKVFDPINPHFLGITKGELDQFWCAPHALLTTEERPSFVRRPVGPPDKAADR